MDAGTKGARIWAQLGAILMGLGMADVRPVTLVGYLVHPQTPLPNLLLTNIKTWISLISLLLIGLMFTWNFVPPMVSALKE